jgi:hypothetical protein
MAALKKIATAYARTDIDGRLRVRRSSLALDAGPPDPIFERSLSLQADGFECRRRQLAKKKVRRSSLIKASEPNRRRDPGLIRRRDGE